jgi:hypothetical protein
VPEKIRAGSKPERTVAGGLREEYHMTIAFQLCGTAR